MSTVVSVKENESSGVDGGDGYTASVNLLKATVYLE